jgi:RimJ/RimL family protein N-acetyltransferase
MNFEPIETGRLVLRPWRAEDVEPYTAFYTDAENAKYVGGQRNADQSWRSLALMIGHWHQKGCGYFAVDEKSTGDFVCCIGLWQSAGWPELELGYWVVRAHQGKGYAFEAAERCLTFARDVVRPPSLVSYIAAENAPSISLAERLGARYEETIELADHGPHGVYRHF